MCPDCHEMWLKANPSGKGRQPIICEICGWTGDGAKLPRKIPMHDGREGPSKRALKLAGRLFFVRIECARQPSDRLIDGIMKTLHLTGLSISKRIVVELPARPDDAQVEALRKLRGVRKVEVV